MIFSIVRSDYIWSECTLTVPVIVLDLVATPGVYIVIIVGVPEFSYPERVVLNLVEKFCRFWNNYYDFIITGSAACKYVSVLAHKITRWPEILITRL